ncbi:IMP dehydrogenase [Candidatus Woesearchaeota archaeon CG1_02_57_44]|nr:MAG: IMP dehydrogenase [Candidatus Woesearchaeota archaeon CG1_02_57_44]
MARHIEETPYLTFDDVLLKPKHSDFLPEETELATRFSRNIRLNIPLASAAMDTVTEHRLAIAMALQGGIGIIHRNLTIEQQAEEVRKVKRFRGGLIPQPYTLTPNHTVADARRMEQENGMSGILLVEDDKLAGIVTSRDLWFQNDPGKKLREIMTEKVITARPGTTLDEAKEILYKHRIEKLPLVDDFGKVAGLFTIKDVRRDMTFPRTVTDPEGRLIVGAAVGPSGEMLERAGALVEAGVDVIVLDTAHGNSQFVIDALAKLKSAYDVDIVAGNVATADTARHLIEAGADGIKVGIGPGSICTTRVVTGIGVPQISAIMDVTAGIRDVPVIADGGIKYAGDIPKAIAAGADCVMIGNLFAGTDESPGETVIINGRSYKEYRGMGSIEAMKKGSKDRYLQAGVHDNDLVPEGIEGIVPYKGPLGHYLHQLVGGLQKGMCDSGCRTIEDMKTRSTLIQISPGSMAESHPHSVTITKESPNYQRQ